LVCSDIASRGLDTKRVSLILSNYSIIIASAVEFGVACPWIVAQFLPFMLMRTQSIRIPNIPIAFDRIGKGTYVFHIIKSIPANRAIDFASQSALNSHNCNGLPSDA